MPGGNVHHLPVLEEAKLTRCERLALEAAKESWLGSVYWLDDCVPMGMAEPVQDRRARGSDEAGGHLASGDAPEPELRP